MRRQTHLDATTISLNDGGELLLVHGDTITFKCSRIPSCAARSFLTVMNFHWRWSALLLQRRGRSTGGAFAVTTTDLARL